MDVQRRAIGYDPELVPPNDPGRLNWETFCREIDRLLAEGYLCHLAYLKGGQIVAIYRTYSQFVQAIRNEPKVDEATLIQPILWELPREIWVNRFTYMPPMKLQLTADRRSAGPQDLRSTSTAPLGNSR